MNIAELMGTLSKLQGFFKQAEQLMAELEPKFEWQGTQLIITVNGEKSDFMPKVKPILDNIKNKNISLGGISVEVRCLDETFALALRE